MSLSDEDVAALDEYVKRAGLPSRLAGVQRAVQLLRYPDLEDDYAEAWAWWSADKDSWAWEGTVGDGGVIDAAR